MATVTGLTLDVEVVNDGANLVANVTAAYRINWSTYDQESEQPYREVCKLIGDDTGITVVYRLDELRRHRPLSPDEQSDLLSHCPPRSSVRGRWSAVT